MALTEFDIIAARTYLGTKWQSRKRNELWVEQEGSCYWCHKMTLMPWDLGYYRTTGSISGKAATLDHMHGKLSGRRSKSIDPDGLVMACSTCNGKRNKKETLDANLRTAFNGG